MDLQSRDRDVRYIVSDLSLQQLACSWLAFKLRGMILLGNTLFQESIVFSFEGQD